MGLEMSKKSFVCGWSFTKLPLGREVDLRRTRSPSSSKRFCIICITTGGDGGDGGDRRRGRGGEEEEGKRGIGK